MEVSSEGGRRGKTNWTLDPKSNSLVLRFAKASPVSGSKVAYDEGHLRQLYMYVECTCSHTALKEELEPGYEEMPVPVQLVGRCRLDRVNTLWHVCAGTSCLTTRSR